jgi:hypothetical protein
MPSAVPPPRPEARAALVVIATSTLLYTIAWIALGEAGIFRDDFDGSAGTVLNLGMLAAAVASLGVGYWYARRRGWTPFGAGCLAVISVPIGLFVGEGLGLRLVG